MSDRIINMVRDQMIQAVVGNFIYTLIELKMAKEVIDVEILDKKIKEYIKENELEEIFTQVKMNSELEILIK